MCLSASCISSPLVTQNHLFPSNFHTLAYPCHIFILLSYSCHTKLSLSLQFSYFGSLHRDFTANARKSKAEAVKWQFFADLKTKRRCVMLTTVLLSPNWHFLCQVFANFKTKTRFASLSAVCLSALSAVHLQARNYLFIFEEPPITTLYGSAKAERRFQWGGNFAHLWTSKRKDEVTIRKGKQFFFLWSQKVQSWLSWRRGAYLPELLTLGWYLLVIFCLRRFKTIIQLLTNILPKHLSPIMKY